MAAYLICQRCLCSRSGDVLGAPCRTEGCDGVIEAQPAFSTLVDVLPEPMICPRRNEVPIEYTPKPDHWKKFKSNGDRVCSFCGSLHPDDFFALVKMCAGIPAEAAFNSIVEIELSDKRYKIYVKRPSVRNAVEGGIKFYTQHLPRDSDINPAVSDEQQKEFKRAVQGSQARFETMLYGERKKPQGA
jgi:hypothetical protein